MSEQGGPDREDLRESAREYVENLPGETALGRVDPATVPPETGSATGSVGGPLDTAGGEVPGGVEGADQA